MHTQSELSALRARPYELLREIERRARKALAAKDRDGGNSQEWVGIAFRVGDRRLLASRDDIREVLIPPALTRVPGAKNWVAGLANVRGQLLPVIDLKQFLDSGTLVSGRTTRVLAINHKAIPAGLLVDEVYGFRRFLDGESSAADTDEINDVFAPYIERRFERGEEAWEVFSLRALVESDPFLMAAEA